MNTKKFEEVFEKQVETSRAVLVTKAKEYAKDTDRLHNFKKAAHFNNQTPEQALWGFVIKHLVALSDMIESGEEFTMAQWDEKIGDSINYLFLLKAQVVETSDDLSWLRETGRHV